MEISDLQAAPRAVALDMAHSVKPTGPSILREKFTYFERCERAEIVPEKPLTVQVDGELYDDLPFTVEVVKDTLRMYRG